MTKLAALALFVFWLVLLGVLAMLLYAPDSVAFLQNIPPVLKSLLQWQSGFYLFALLYIAARFQNHLGFLKETHRTLGDFTNVGYTSIRFISLGDWLFLMITNNIVLVVWYFTCLKGY